MKTTMLGFLPAAGCAADGAVWHRSAVPKAATTATVRKPRCVINVCIALSFLLGATSAPHPRPDAAATPYTRVVSPPSLPRPGHCTAWRAAATASSGRGSRIPGDPERHVDLVLLPE